MSEEGGDNDDVFVELVSLDDKHFQIPVAAAKHAKLVRRSLGGDDDDDDDNFEIVGSKTVDLLRVRGEALQRVVDFLNHYHTQPMREIPTPLGSHSFDEVGSTRLDVKRVA